MADRNGNPYGDTEEERVLNECIKKAYWEMGGCYDELADRVIRYLLEHGYSLQRHQPNR